MKYLLIDQESERLKFRLLKEQDATDWEKLFDAQNIATFLGLDVSLTKKELCDVWFEKVFNRYENDLGGMNVLIDKKSNKMIGQCGLLIQQIEGQRRLEIGYSILPEYWNQGFASEAAQKCRDYAFENKFDQSLTSIVHIDNISSEKVALKNGMQLEKRIDDYHGNPINLFSIQRERWIELKSLSLDNIRKSI
jgi:RimJ/RimL family protein N-acetyltransferase